MAVPDNWIAGASYAATNEDAVARAINGSGWLQPCHYGTTGAETYTIASGSVTQITGTTVDGGSPLVGERILIKDAPAASGVGSGFSSQPANGLYQVTANATNLSLSRVYEMSASPSIPYVPSAEVVAVMGGPTNGGVLFIVATPSSPGVFTYGTGAIQFGTVTPKIGTGLTLTTNTLALSSSVQANLALAATALQTVSSSSLTDSTATGISLVSATSSTAALATLGGAEATGKYIVGGTSDSTLTNAQFLGALGTGLLKVTTTTGVLSTAVSGTDYAPATTGGSILKASFGGFASAVSGTDYAPATTGSSILKASAGGFANAVSGTDYAPPSSGSTALKGNGSGGFSAAVLNDVGAATAAYSINSQRLTTLANPISAQDAVTKVYVDSSGYHPWCRVATTGTESFTITSGSVITIGGTTVDGISLSIGDRILVKDAPSVTGTGTVGSSVPANGIYVVTANTTNLTVARATDMASGGSSATPAGAAVVVTAGSNAQDSWKVSSPTSSASFTYGTTAIAWVSDVVPGTGLTRSGNTLNVSGVPISTLATTGTPSSTTYLNGTGAWAAPAIPSDFIVVQFGPATVRAAGTGDFPTGFYVGRAFTATSITYQFDVADGSGSTVVNLLHNGTSVSAAAATVSAANQADGSGTDSARTATFSQSYAIGDRIALSIVSVGGTPGNGLRAWVTGTWN
jgi:hypothetical protein